MVTARKENKNRGSVYLVFEYLDHDLHGLLDLKTKFAKSEIKCILLQILEGLAYMHEKGFMHRDIKGGNILMNKNGIVKLADFGLSRVLESATPYYTTRVVTLWYRAPELLFGMKDYSTAIDIWSVG